MLATGGVAVLALGVAYLSGVLPGQAPSEPEFDYGRKGVLVRKLREELAEAPCDRPKAAEYLQAVFSANDLRGSIRFADDFIARCGKFPQLRSITYSAHTRLNEFELAIKDATELIESSPGNAGYWVWRGMAHEANSAPVLALADYQQAFRLKPDEFQAMNQLATAYGRQRRPCDAYLVLLEHVQINPTSGGRPDVRTWLAGLASDGTCVLGTGKAVVPAPKARGDEMWVEPLVDGKTRGRFRLDTGATMVTLSRAFADRLGLKLADGAPTVPLRTAQGIVQAHIARVRSLELQDARADDVEVAVVPSLPEGVDGVLGLGFLARFEMKRDLKAGVLELLERKPLEPAARN